MDVPEIEAFLTYLAKQENVAASTQNQAFSSLLFLYRHVLDIQLEDRINALRARNSRYLPTVLTVVEVQTVIKKVAMLSVIPSLPIYYKTATISVPSRNC
jgi:site-specific recombinase XerD